MQGRRMFCVAVALTFFACAGSAQEWPQWRGPNRDNVSAETGLLKTWPADGPKLLWSTEGLGIGFSSVAVAGGTLYTGGSLDGNDSLVALGLDGTLKWTTPNGGSWELTPDVKWAKGRHFEGARATPTVHDGLVFYLSGHGRLAAFDAGSGAEVWVVDVVAAFDAELPKWGYSESVLVDGERVVCCPGGRKAYMVALDRKTGETVWTTTGIADRASYCSPLLVEDKGVRQIITMSATAVLGVNADTGKLLWRHPFANKHKINAVTPIYSNGYVFVSNGYGNGSELLKLENGRDGFIVSGLYSNDDLDSNHSGVVLVDGHVYGTGYNKQKLFCLDFLTGRERYSEKGVGRGSLAYADGMLYCLGEKGQVALVKAAPDTYREVARFAAPSGGTGLYWAHPVVCGGRLYIRHADKLFCYDVSGK